MTRTVLVGAHVFDGTGADPYRADIAIEADRIVAVGPGLDGDQQVDLAGSTVLPGLFDCHVHVVASGFDMLKLLEQPFSYQFYVAAENLHRTLATGITTVRDGGGADLGIKKAVADGLIPGPRLQISLTMLSQTGGHGDDWMPSGARVPLLSSHPGVPDGIVDGPDAVRRKVRELRRMGADVIKVATSGGVLSPMSDPRRAQLSPEELEVMVAEASAAGIFVMAHAQAADGIKNALRAGIRSIEHGIYLDDEAIELLLERQAWLVPTLVAPRGVLDAAEAGTKMPAAFVEKAMSVVEAHQVSFRRAVEAGVRIAMGTDSGVTPHGQNLRELALMVQGGMTPAAALEATTRSAAQLLGLEADLGTIEPGRLADFVVIDGDPYELATLAQRIRMVWKAGTPVVRAA